MKVGILGRNDYWGKTFTEQDYRVVREAKIELVKIFEYTDLSVFQRLRDENPALAFIVRLYDEAGLGQPEEFVNRHAWRIEQLRPFATDFEILNEPNRAEEGWGPAADQAQRFNHWYLEVLERLRALLPRASFGFPGLSPHPPGETISDLEWLQICQEAVQASDWLGCHCYWSDEAGMLHHSDGLRFTQYHTLFPDKTIHITEFNSHPTLIDQWQRATQYRRYYTTLGDYPYVASASAFIISSPDPAWDALAWWAPQSGQSRPVVWEVGSIPRPIGDPQEKPVYDVKYLSHNTPGTMVAGQTNAVRLTLKNAGRKTWLASGYNKVRLGYHWHNHDGSLVPASLWADLRTALPHDLRPDEHLTLQAEVGPPVVEGQYILKWDMVEEMVTWFAWQEVPTLDVRVQVEPAPPSPVPGAARPSASHNNVQSGPDNLRQALDGSPYTRWSTFTPQRPGMWFRLDLGQLMTISHLRLDNSFSPKDYPRGYVVRLSTDGAHWTTVAENHANGGPLDVTFTPQLTRYIHIDQTGSDSFYWWSIHAIEIEADPAGGWTISASHNNVQSGADNLSFALDGNPQTRWSSREPQRPGMWFALDLGAVQTLSRLELVNEGSPQDYPRGYVVKLSTNGQNWEMVSSVKNNDRPLVITFPPRSARYVHVEQTGSDSFYWWSIHEILVSEEPVITASASHNDVLSGPDNLRQALDSLAHTRWSTRALQTPGMWFELDLSQTKTVRGLSLDNTASPFDYPRGYVVRVSADGVNWQTVAKNSANDRPLDLDFAPRQVRYLRVEQTGSSTRYWWSIHEVYVK